MGFKQKEYIATFNKQTYRMFPFRVRKDNLAVIQKLQNVPSMNSYVNSLIEKDISSSVLTIKQIKERILPVLKAHKINEIYLFGSYARGEANNDSDIDIYCDSGDIQSLIDQVALIEQLQNASKKEIDLIFIGSKMDDFFKEQLELDKIRIC